MISYGGYPAGIALTDRAFISKAPKKDVKAANKEAKAKAKETGEKAHKLNAIYRIIPWDFFDPEDYDILERKDKEIEDMRSKAKTRPSLYSRAKLCTKRSESTAPMR